MEGYRCLHCGSKMIHLSYWLHSRMGILSCLTCGENEDSAKGISYNGKRIMKSVYKRTDKDGSAIKNKTYEGEDS